MIVALSAGERGAKENSGGGVGAIDDLLDTILFGIGAQCVLIVPSFAPMLSGQIAPCLIQACKVASSALLSGLPSGGMASSPSTKPAARS